MRELDELENYISSRAASIGSGVEYHPARIWIPGSIMAAMEFGDVFMRYYGLQFKFKQVLGPPGSAPKYNKNILDRAADYWRHQKEVATRVQTVQAEPSQSTSTNELFDQQQVSSKLEYPMHWSRWSISNEESVHSTLTDEIGLKRSFRIYKLDPRVYGGDEYHDLGLCRAHFTKSEICCLSWELCPFRHWQLRRQKRHGLILLGLRQSKRWNEAHCMLQTTHLDDTVADRVG